MHPWRTTSLFADYLLEHELYASPPSAPSPDSSGPPTHPSTSGYLTDTDELAALRYIHSALQRVASYAAGRKEESTILHDLMAFVDTVSRHLPISDPAMRFYLLVPTRSMLYWHPTSLLSRSGPLAATDPVSLVVLAHLYAISLTVQPVFAGSGAAHFRGLSCAPIEEIYGVLVAMHRAGGETMETFVPLSLMHFPMQAVSLFRSRMGLDPGVADADQSLTAIRYGVDPLVDAVDAVSLEE
jgi:hypothetical protein